MKRLETVFLMRHGLTVWNSLRRLQGVRDSPLSAIGRIQALQLAVALQGESPEALWCSPLGRARETAGIVGGALGLQPTVLKDLHEISFGDWESFNLAELDIRWPGGWKRWCADSWHTRPPGGENYIDAEVRARRSIAHLQAAQKGRLAVVGHYAFNRLLMALWLDWDPEEAMSVNIPHEAIYRIQRANGEWAVSHRRTDAKEGWQDGTIPFVPHN